MSRDRFLIFPQEMVKIYAPQIFGQSADILTSRAGTTAGTVRERCSPYKLGGLSASLEDYMNEREHHLNESSSARLGRSQKLEILPSPNSKQTQSLGANFLMDAKLWRIYFTRRGDFNVRLVSVLYHVVQ